jgi:hypothetical protein
MRDSPSIVPGPEERKSTWVLDDFGGTARPSIAEVDEERTDRGMVITDLASIPIPSTLRGAHLQDELQNNYQRLPIR